MKGRLKARGGGRRGTAPQERDAISGQRFGSTAPTPGLNTSSVVGARRIRGRTTIGSCDAGAGSKRSAGFGRATSVGLNARRFGTSGLSRGKAGRSSLTTGEHAGLLWNTDEAAATLPSYAAHFAYASQFLCGNQAVRRVHPTIFH